MRSKSLENNKLNSTQERLRYLRSLTRLDRSQFSAKYSIPEVTLRFWESGRTPLTDKGIIRCIDAYKKESIDVSEEWIRHGTGNPPTLNYNSLSFLKNIPLTEVPLDENVENDLVLFKNQYPNSILFKVVTQEMMPCYKPGDFVLGKTNNENMLKAQNKDSIVLLQNGELLFRRVYITEENKVHLVCINNSSKEFIIFDAKVLSIAPVFVHYIS